MRKGLYSSLVFCLIGQMTAPCQAGPLLDWLLHRRPACAPVAVNPCAPQTQVTMRYERQTFYRTDWVRVPVTNYRPVTTVDPATGCPVSCMRPCTTYAWQARRVPYTTWRPVYSAAPAGFAAPAAAGCAGCGQAAGGAAVPLQGAPLQAAPGQAMPQQAYPQQAYPQQVAPPQGGVQAVPSQPSYGGYGEGAQPGATGGAAPADRPPSLSPDEVPGSSRRYPPLGSPHQPPASPSTTPPAGVTPPVAPDASETPAEGDAANKPTSARGRIYDLRPIPDPDVQPRNDASGPSAAPQLLNPRDRTAAYPVRQVWAYTSISWAKPASNSSQSVARADAASSELELEPPQAAAPRREAQVDAFQPLKAASSHDRGWRTVRP